MDLKEVVKTVVQSEEELNTSLSTYEVDGYITTTTEESQRVLLEVLEENDFYVYDTQFIDGLYRLYIEL